LSIVQINLATFHTRGLLKFKDLKDVAHGDEKWFFLCEDEERYMLLDDKDDPKWHSRHKGYITKVTFLNFQAKPWYAAGLGWWDGKDGICPIGYVEQAERSSINRPKGADVWVNDTIDKDQY
jgi:hypothetical protein